MINYSMFKMSASLVVSVCIIVFTVLPKVVMFVTFPILLFLRSYHINNCKRHYVNHYFHFKTYSTLLIALRIFRYAVHLNFLLLFVLCICTKVGKLYV